MKKYFVCFLTVFLLSFWGVKSYAQTPESSLNSRISASNSNANNATYIKWNPIKKETHFETKNIEYLHFEGAVYYTEKNFIPRFYHSEKVNTSQKNVQLNLSNTIYTACNTLENALLKAAPENDITNSINVKSGITKSGKESYVYFEFAPFIKDASGNFSKLVSFEYTLDFSTSQSMEKKAAASFKANSVLAQGTWYKIGVTQTGIHRISKSFLAEMGFPVNNINPQQIRVFGNGGGMLPERNEFSRPDDLEENAIWVQGEADGRFDDSDYILFYARGPHTWHREGDYFKHRQNIYSDTAYYFITYDGGIGVPKRIKPKSANTASPNATVTTFNDYQFHERELVNLIKSGKEWYGESFGLATAYTINFSFPNINTTANTRVDAVVVSRSIGAQSSFTVNVPGMASGSISLNSVQSEYYSTYATKGNVTLNFIPNSANISVNVNFNKANPSAVGWLDFIEVNTRRNLSFASAPLYFRDLQSIGQIAQYRISNPTSAMTVWDVTDIYDVSIQPYSINNNIAVFVENNVDLREFVAFANEGFLTPTYQKQVLNQNLHATQPVDYIIITDPMFISQAEELAEFHKEKNGYSSVIATTFDIYNEFSSGAQDLTAIRDFVRMLYTRANTGPNAPKYLLLFGDASYDFKYRFTGNSNLVPAYQSQGSLSPTDSYVTDDYFGLLDDDEGNWQNQNAENVDIGIGRLTVKSVRQAQDAVRKIKAYHSKDSFGPWRNYVAYVGDDEDQYKSLIHMADANRLATQIDTLYKVYNLDKIFFDAYPQISTPGGNRYPDVKEAINRRVDRGALSINYIGHGGVLGWAHERVLENSDINRWQNSKNMPLFVTATCEFTRFDDPQRTSAGEFVFLNPNGGGIALLTTTRIVYSSPNFELSREFNKHVFNPLGNTMPTLGDLNRLTKINAVNNVNNRCFVLIGDPAMKLAYPQYKVFTSAVPDTIKALQKVTIKGYVANLDSSIKSDFNGIVYPIVFDKESEIRTLDNQGNGVFTFNFRNNILFRGRASVKNGQFEFTFVVPKDITYNFGIGRISYYADNANIDAHGYSENFIVGGTFDGAPEDTDGPEIKLFLNNESFVNGGLTDQNPRLLANVFDESGVNTVGSSIGHDIVAVLDGNTANAIILNEYYESELDSYQKGMVKYPFKDIAEGKHNLKLKVWDVYNNSSEESVDFVVAKDANLALKHVLNYPNPFTTKTSFYFEHNQAERDLQVRLSIFTVSGKIVKTIDGIYNSTGFRVGPIDWDGLDDFGDRIGRGVYIYQLKVTAPTGEIADTFEKLVILN